MAAELEPVDARLIAVAQRCLDAAYDATMAFPDIVAMLSASGFESYAVDYRRGTTTYYLSDGRSVLLDNPGAGGTVAATFDQPGVATQIKWAQDNPPGYSYAAFCSNVKALGCAGYLVSFLGRRVLYFGRTAETHVEHFPQ